MLKNKTGQWVILAIIILVICLCCVIPFIGMDYPYYTSVLLDVDTNIIEQEIIRNLPKPNNLDISISRVDINYSDHPLGKESTFVSFAINCFGEDKPSKEQCLAILMGIYDCINENVLTEVVRKELPYNEKSRGIKWVRIGISYEDKSHLWKRTYLSTREKYNLNEWKMTYEGYALSSEHIVIIRSGIPLIYQRIEP